MTDLGAGAVPFGLMPWAWVTDERRSFRALQGRGPLRVAPILQELILNRFPDETATWVERVCGLDFTRVIGSHMDNDVRARPADLRRAFGFLGTPRGDSPGNAPEEADLRFLRNASDACTRLGITGPPRTTPRRPRWWRRRGGALAMSCTGGAGSPAAPLPPSAVPARRDGVYGVVMIGLFRLAFGAWPERFFVIAPDGDLVYAAQPGATGYDHDAVWREIEEVLAGQACAPARP